MIVDTSALVALARREPEYLPLAQAMRSETCIIPAPVLVEFMRVTALPDNRPDPVAGALMRELGAVGVTTIPFDARAAEAAVAANARFGTGNGRGGRLNMLDLMVYGVAKVSGLPILCTGRDFAATDAALHPASRAF